MTDYINTPPVQELWTRALRALGDVKNGDYLPLGRLQAAFGLEFAALPVAQQRQIALIVRALVYYLQHHSDAAAGLD